MEELDIDPLDFAGELLVDPLKDADGMGDDGVGAGGAQVLGGEPLEYFVAQAVGGLEGQMERWGVGDADPLGVGRGDAKLLAKLPDLRAGAVDQHHLDVQRPEDRDVGQDVAKILLGDDRAIDADDEDALPEARDVLEDSPEVGQFHVLRRGWEKAVVMRVRPRRLSKLRRSGRSPPGRRR